VSVDALTSVVSSSTFMPFGSLRSGGPVGTERTFTGQIDDAGTGLMFYNARYYDPVVGRFTQADTVLDCLVRWVKWPMVSRRLVSACSITASPGVGS
jgi:RHS repeat-associated protein